MAVLIFLEAYKPLETSFALKLEILNECCIMLMLYVLLCFSEYQPDLEVRNSLGFLYIGVIGIFALIHIGLLIYFTGKAVLAKIRQKCAQRK